MSDGRPERSVVQSPDAIVRSLPDGEAVVMNLSSEVYHGLNATAYRMWEALTTTPNVAAAHDHLLTEMGTDDERLWSDLNRLVDELESLGLVVVTTSS